MDDRQFPIRRFADDTSFRAAITAMDRVREEEACIGGQPSLYYKGLRYCGTGWEVSSVGKDFAVVQHPDALADLGEGLQELGICPRGEICESSRGVLTAALHFFNPKFDIARMVGALADDATCHIGILVTSAHGAPPSCLALEAMAESSDGTQYLVSDILGSRRFRHVGRLRGNLKALVHEMVQGLPVLGQYIANAKAAPLTIEQVSWALRALDYGPKGRKALLHRTYANAWALYDRLCKFARRGELNAGSRMAELRRAQALLDPHRRYLLLEQGKQLELDDEAAREAALQTTLDALPTPIGAAA